VRVSTVADRVGGPLAPYAPGFAAALDRSGYAPKTVASHLRLLAHLSRWMAGRHLDAASLTTSVIAAYFADRRAAGYVEHVSAQAVAPLIDYLRAAGVDTAVTSAPPSPLAALLDRFGDYLLTERGLDPRTIGRYVVLARAFLTRQLVPESGRLGRLTSAEVTAFVVDWCHQPRPRSAKLMVTALRSLLRFLHLEGMTAQSLVEAVPAVAGWKLAGLPHGLDPGGVQALLAASQSRVGAVGSRDRAILTMLTRLGLRVGEVAALSLGDIDWHRGEFMVRGKGDRHERLPLPADVGQAIVAYLEHGRHRGGPDRAVFLAVRAPYRRLSPGAVTQIVVRTADRAGLGRVTGHRLRHSVASNLLRAGAGLGEIGQLLRHQHTQTTMIYAKVDDGMLRRVARPWPEAAV
jgi:integrase/recombinase XerD